MQATFAYSPLGKALGNQTKMIKGQGKKQTKAIEDHEKQLIKSNELIKVTCSWYFVHSSLRASKNKSLIFPY